MTLRLVGSPGFFRPALLLIVLATTTLAGCAYFNTFFHAKKFYGQAQDIEEDERKERERKAVATGPNAAQTVTRAASMYTNAIEKCRKVLADHPDSRWADDAQFLMARSFYGKADYLAARRELGRLETRFPKSNLLDDAKFWMGLTAFSEEEYGEAERHWTALLEKNPKYGNRVEVEYYIAETLRHRGEYLAASEAYDTFLKEHGKHARATEIRLNLGDMLMEQKLYEEAQAVFLEVSRRGRERFDRVRARMRLGDAYELNRQFDEALEIYTDLAYEMDSRYLDGRMTAAEREALREAELKAQLEAREIAALDSTLAAVAVNAGDPNDPNNPNAQGNQDLNDPNNLNTNPDDPFADLDDNQQNDPLDPLDPLNPNNPNDLNQTGQNQQNQNQQNQNQQNQAQQNQAQQNPTAGRRSGLPANDPNYTNLARVLLREGRVLAANKRPWDAVLAYEQVIAEYQRTEFAAEAQYRIGYTYEVYLEDYEAAETAYRSVSSQGRSSFNEDAARRAQNLLRVKELAGAADSLDVVSDAAADARFMRAELYLFQQEKPERALEEYVALQNDFVGTDQAAKALLAEAWVRFHALADTARGRAKYSEVARRFPDSIYGRNANRFLKGPEREPKDDEFYGPSLDELLSEENLVQFASLDTIVAVADSLPADSLALVAQTVAGDSASAPEGAVGFEPLDIPPGEGNPPDAQIVDPLDLFAVPEIGPNSLASLPLPVDDVEFDRDSPEVAPDPAGGIEGISPEEARAFLDSLRSAVGEDSVATPVSGDSLNAPAVLDSLRMPSATDSLRMPSAMDSLRMPSATDSLPMPSATDSLRVPAHEDSLHTPAPSDSSAGR